MVHSRNQILLKNQGTRLPAPPGRFRPPVLINLLPPERSHLSVFCSIFHLATSRQDGVIIFPRLAYGNSNRFFHNVLIETRVGVSGRRRRRGQAPRRVRWCGPGNRRTHPADATHMEKGRLIHRRQFISNGLLQNRGRDLCLQLLITPTFRFSFTSTRYPSNDAAPGTQSSFVKNIAQT